MSTPKAPASRSLLRQGPFQRFWLGQTLSMAGSQVSLLALPLTAVLLLHAGPLQTGLLTGAGRLPPLLFGLLVGVWVDRFRHRPILIGTDLLRALVLGWVPIADALGVLAIWQLYLVAFVIGVLSLLSDVAAQSYLPWITSAETVIEGNTKLEVSRSGSDMVGPSLAGVLVQVLSAPAAILADVVSYLVSAVFMTSVRADKPVSAVPQTRASMLVEIREGLRFVLGSQLLRWNALASALSNLFTNVLLAIFLLYAVRDLKLEPGVVGTVIGIGGIGALIGASLGAFLARRLGLGRALITSTGVTGSGAFLMSLSNGSTAVRIVWVSAAYLLFCFGYPAFNVAVISLRQLLSPPQLLGRTNATMRFLAWGTMPIGALLGGLLGDWFGLRAAMVTAGVGLLLPPLVLLVSPLRAVHTVAPHQEPAVDPPVLTAG